jgi:hypothetical protein
MVEPVRHRQTKGTGTDMFDLQPPRHTSTLHVSEVALRPALVRYEVQTRQRRTREMTGRWQRRVEAPQIHGELLKLGIEVAESTVAKYMIKHPRRLGQSWRAFLRNHAEDAAAVDFLIVPTIATVARRQYTDPLP